MNDKFELPIQMLDEPDFDLTRLRNGYVQLADEHLVDPRYQDGGTEMLGYLFAALILTLAAIGIGFIIGRYLW